MSIPMPKFNWRGFIKRDDLIIDNFIFRLHHQANFLVVAFGVAFILGENYLDHKAIVCSGGATDYDKKFCWLHGASRISPEFQKILAKSSRHFDCTGSTEGGDNDEILTAYYVWLPFLLAIAAGLCKLPRILWKEFLEGNTMKKLIMRGNNNCLDLELACKVFKKMKKDKTLHWFSIKMIGCEVLNILMVILSLFIFNYSLNGQYSSYGWKTLTYMNSEGPASNPMCEVFPTVVSCDTTKMGITKSEEKGNFACILSNNLFNMYYFLILWFWWVGLLAVSCINLLLRFFQVTWPAHYPTYKILGGKLSFCEIPVLQLLENNLGSLEYEHLRNLIYEEREEDSNGRLLGPKLKDPVNDIA